MVVNEITVWDGFQIPESVYAAYRRLGTLLNRSTKQLLCDVLEYSLGCGLGTPPEWWLTPLHEEVLVTVGRGPSDHAPDSGRRYPLRLPQDLHESYATISHGLGLAVEDLLSESIVAAIQIASTSPAWWDLCCEPLTPAGSGLGNHQPPQSGVDLALLIRAQDQPSHEPTLHPPNPLGRQAARQPDQAASGRQAQGEPRPPSITLNDKE